MVYTLKDIKHLETMASLKDQAIEEEKPIFLTSEDTSLTSTLLKLCNKLRAEGFNKYAESIENKFVNYKAASVHLYQAHKETGEDLVNQAHPEGDNKIVSDVSDNYGDVETIVSKHKKIVDVVNKQPTGKLASYINQCKIALGQTAQRKIVNLANAAKHNITQAIGIAKGTGGISNTMWFIGPLNSSYVNFMKTMNTNPISVSDINDAESELDIIENRLEPMLGKGVENLWEKVKQFIDAAKNNLVSIKALVVETYSNNEEQPDAGSEESDKPTQTVLSAVIEKVKLELEQASSLVKSVNTFASKAADATKADFLKKVVGSVQSYVNDVKSVLAKLMEMQNNEQKLDLNKLNEVVSGISRFSNVSTYDELKSAISGYHSKLAEAFNYMKQW